MSEKTSFLLKQLPHLGPDVTTTPSVRTPTTRPSVFPFLISFSRREGGRVADRVVLFCASTRGLFPGGVDGRMYSRMAGYSNRDPLFVANP